MKNTIKLYLFLSILLAIFIPTCSAQIFCNYHAYRDCVASSIYWFDSCGNRQDLYQNCLGTNQTCQYGQCVVSNPYLLHYRLSCLSGNLYWYDSNGASQGLYKSCADSNQCTADSCSGAKCSNTIKCDGSTCALGSADYTTYCAVINNPNPPQVQPEVQPAAAVFVGSSDSSFMKFLKRWYLWILVAIVLIFLFIVVFRRFSSST